MGKQRIVVGLARVESVYGGPEEGGWDFERGTPLGGYRTFYNRDAALDYRTHLYERIERGDAFRGVGVGGCGDNDDMVRGGVSSDGLEATMQDQRSGGLRAWPDRYPVYE